MKPKGRLHLFRRGSQSVGLLVGLLGFTGIGVTHLIFPGLHCYACPLAVTVCPIGLVQNLIINGTVPFYWLGTIALYGLALGRGFCGWFCPFGTLNDLLSFRKVRFRRVLSPLKFLVLVGTVVAAWRFGDTMFCKLCPAGGLEASLPYLGLGIAEPSTPFWVHMGTLGGTILGMILVSRFWCRYLCPMGALLSLFNRLSFLGLRIRQDRCTSCGLCSRACPMGIEPHREGDSSNCIRCGECVGACPHQALSLGLSIPGEHGFRKVRASRVNAGSDRVSPDQ